MPSVAPAVPEISLSLALAAPGGAAHTFDLATRAVVVAVVGPPRFGREAEVLAGVAAAFAAGADVVEVPSELRLLGPAARQAEGPVAARATSAEAARAALSAGCGLLLVPRTVVADLGKEPAAVLVDSAVAGRDAVTEHPDVPVALDVTGLAGADAVSEESLGLAVGVRLIRTSDIRRTRRVVEVMDHLLAARR